MRAFCRHTLWGSLHRKGSDGLSHRGTGLGRLLMERAMATIPELFGDKKSIRIEAQAHLEKFYGSLGFVTQSKPYMLDGIPHIEMLF